VKRVLLLATTTGYQIRSFGDASQALGVKLVFASDRCDRLDDPWWDGAIPVRFHDEEASVDAIVSTFGARPPDGILAVGDRPTVLAAQVAARVGLPGNPPDAAYASRHKRKAREAFRAAGLATPTFRALRIDEPPGPYEDDIGFPAVVKPVALSGSRGVMRVNDSGELMAALERLRALLASADVRLERDAAHDQVVLERFVPGTEYAVEGVLTRGVFHAFAIFDKPDPLDGPFFEETIYLTPSRQPPSAQQRLLDTVAAAARALGLHHGPVHAECRVNDTGIYVLEVAARPIGGLCARALRFVTPSGTLASLEEILLRHALGEDVTVYPREAEASGVMMLPIPRRGIYRGVDGVEAARGVPGIDDVHITAKPDALLVPLPEGRSYLGFLFAHGDSAERTERSLREAHAALRFRIDREVILAERS
jgi:biotin carboxylase